MLKGPRWQLLTSTPRPAEAARRRFAPEFLNRIDKTIVFRTLGEPELRNILTIELKILQERIFHSTPAVPFVFSVMESARDYLLQQGTDLKYGARHLKRAIDQSLVHPLSNLIATGQVRGGDLIRVDYDKVSGRVTFFKDTENMPLSAMAQMADISRVARAPALLAKAVSHSSGATNIRSPRRQAIWHSRITLPSELKATPKISGTAPRPPTSKRMPPSDTSRIKHSTHAASGSGIKKPGL